MGGPLSLSARTFSLDRISTRTPPRTSRSNLVDRMSESAQRFLHGIPLLPKPPLPWRNNPYDLEYQRQLNGGCLDFEEFPPQDIIQQRALLVRADSDETTERARRVQAYQPATMPTVPEDIFPSVDVP